MIYKVLLVFKTRIVTAVDLPEGTELEEIITAAVEQNEYAGEPELDSAQVLGEV